MSSGIGGSSGHFGAGFRGKKEDSGSEKPDQRIQWVVLAALGKLEDINRHLKKETPTLKDRLMAIKAAARAGFPQIIKSLLVNFEMPTNERIRAILVAVKNGHRGPVETLLNGFEIPKDQRIRAILVAAENGHTGPVDVLLNGFEMPAVDCGKAVRLAAKNGHVEVIKRLFEAAVIKDTDVDYAFLYATQNGHKSVIEWLLEKHPAIPTPLRGKFVEIAAGNGDKSIVEMLLVNPEAISKALRGNAISKAAANGHLAVLQRLLADDNQVLPQFRGEAIVAAAKNGQCEVVPSLMRDSHGNIIDIEEEHLLKALDAHKNATPGQIPYNIGRLGTVFIENARNLSQDFILRLYDLMDDEDGVLRIPIFGHLMAEPLFYLEKYCEKGFPEVRFVDPTMHGQDVSNQVLADFILLNLQHKKIISVGENERFLSAKLPVTEKTYQQEGLFRFGQLLTHLYTLFIEQGIRIRVPENILNPDILSAIGKNPENMLDSIDCTPFIRDIWKNTPEEEDKSWKESVIQAIHCMEQGIGPVLKKAIEEGVNPTPTWIFFGRD